MNDTKYFSRSWALLTRDKGWIKPILVMSVASLVPIVGSFGNSGYALEWGRLTAWGVDAAPKQKNVDVGKCISSGARAFVVYLGLQTAVFVAYSLISLAISFIPDALGVLIGGFVSMVLSIAMSIAGVVITLAQLRCAIYESIGAGYRLDRVFELIGKDTRGFLRVFLVNFVCGLVIAVIVVFFVIMGMLLLVPVVLSLSNGNYSDRMVPAMLASMIIPLVLGTVLFGYIISLLSNGVRLIVTTSLALWLRQFDVPNWGRSEEPLPDGVGPQGASQYQYAQPPAAQRREQPTGQQPQQQPPVQQQPAQQPQQAPQQLLPTQRLQQQPPVQPIAQQPTVQQQPPAEPTAQPATQQPAQEPVQPQVSQPQNPITQPPTQRLPKKSEPEDLYDSLADAIKDNDRVEGDD